MKKASLDPFELKSYRSVSNLSFTSKLIERLAVNRFNQHISTNQLLPDCQSAYRRHHSTETAIAIVINNIARTIDSGKVCALVLLDLSAAFDTVDHRILTEVLKRRFAVEGTALEWFESYFSGRTQTFYVADASSRPVPLICGVPQGSILGPTVFVAYTEEIQTSLTLVYHLYADDTQLLACCPVFFIDICRHSIE